MWAVAKTITRSSFSHHFGLEKKLHKDKRKELWKPESGKWCNIFISGVWFRTTNVIWNWK